ncbi:uncharacterized protein LOC141782540 isoform X1 [Sebastes fasciatus]|uniref:uncharacterized protein LOC141782540 isoform X1 n=1 Tax=Sebastes fasciatus TaxID=394691 RepID=UPI003D9E8BFA
MNTSGRMDKLTYTYLLMFCCLTFVCIDGRVQDLIPSCEVEVMVWRGTTWETAPQQNLSVSCPVKHCGESIKVTWCKLLHTNTCEQMNYTENVETNTTQDELISYLNFTRISIHDNGLYRCNVKGDKYEQISNIINISVSDSYQGVKHLPNTHSDNNKDELPSAAGDEDVSWLPYFIIPVSIALLVVTLTVLTLLSFYGWKRIQNHTKGQETPTRMLPDLPSPSAPSILALHDTYSPSTAESPPSAPPMMTTNGNQPAVANTADGGQGSLYAVYSTVNHRQSGIPATEQHAATEQKKKTGYAAIIVS